MHYTYKISIESENGFLGKLGIKVLHSVLSNTFEQCLVNWKKGQQYPAFKIFHVSKNNIYMSISRELSAKCFSFVHGTGYSTKVCVEQEVIGQEYNFNTNDRVMSFGKLSMYKNQKMGGKRKKTALVRSSYTNMFLNKDEFYSIIKERTGINPVDIVVEPIYINKNLVPNGKEINSAFYISIIGTVEDYNITNLLSCTSIGQDVGYGFGALDVRKL